MTTPAIQSDRTEQRNAVRSLTNLFHLTLETLPDELVADCELRGIKPARGLYATRVYVSIANVDVTATLPTRLVEGGIHYSQLPFAPRLEALGDYHFEQQRTNEWVERRGQLERFAALGAFNFAVNLVWLAIEPTSPSANNWWLVIARMLGIWVIYGLSMTDNWLRLLSNRAPCPTLSDLERRAFEHWRKARLEEGVSG